VDRQHAEPAADPRVRADCHRRAALVPGGGEPRARGGQRVGDVEVAAARHAEHGGDIGSRQGRADRVRDSGDTKVPSMPLGAATVPSDLVFTTLYNGTLIALDRRSGAIVYRRSLPASTNAPIAIAGNAVLVPAGALRTSGSGGGGRPQLVAYTVG
jgi:outer membrane protein assembly factor BamB